MTDIFGSNKVFKVVGPPGSGKTKFAAAQAKRAIEKWGPDSVLITSLTRAAAGEVAGRDTGVGREFMGTVHAHCYRALGRPRLFDAAMRKLWNEANPLLSLSGAVAGLDDAPGEEASSGFGDALLADLDACRHRLMPEGEIPPEVAQFGREYEAFKDEAGCFDFTDLIDVALREVDLPESLRVLIVDEGQDSSALEAKLLGKWSRAMDSTLVIGDPFQSMYAFRGASQFIFAGEIFKVLGQSWRVPRSVQAAALSIAMEMSDYRSFEYAPRDEEGTIGSCGPLMHRDTIGELIEQIEQRQGGEERTMVIGSCGYMVAPLVTALRQAGLPYCNPSGRWSPLASQRGQISTTRRLISLLNGTELSGDDRGWTVADIQSFAPLLTSESGNGRADGALKRGAKARLAEVSEDEASGMDGFFLAREVLCPGAFDILRRGNLSEIPALFMASAAVTYPITVAQRWGVDALTKEPQAIVGTIHSVKGAEAEHVVVASDLSPNGDKTYKSDGWDGRDAILRAFYVAATRAKQTLTVAMGSSKYTCDEIEAIVE